MSLGSHGDSGDVDSVLRARCGSSPSRGKPFSSTSVDLVEDLLEDRQYGSALRTLEALVSPTLYPTSAVLDKLLSLSLHTDAATDVPFEVKVHAASILCFVYDLRGSEPFRSLLTESDGEARLWKLLRQATGVWTPAKQENNGTESARAAREGFSTPIVRFMIEVVGRDLGECYAAGGIAASILARSLGSPRKLDYSPALDAMTEMLESDGEDAIGLVGALIFEVSLLAAAGSSDLKAFVRELLPVLKDLETSRLFAVLQEIPSDTLRSTIAEMLLFKICLANRKHANSTASTRPLPAATLKHLSVTPVAKTNWEVTVRLVTLLVGNLAALDEQQVELLREATKSFVGRIPPRAVSAECERALTDLVEIMGA